MDFETRELRCQCQEPLVSPQLSLFEEGTP